MGAPQNGCHPTGQILSPDWGRVEDRRAGCRSRGLLLPAAFASMPVPQPRPWLRFPSPLIEPDVRLYRIRLSDGLRETVTDTPKFPPCWALIFPPSARRRDG